MSGRSKAQVVLTSYSFDERESMDAYLDEWQSIRHTQAAGAGLDAGSETEDEKEDQGIFTNPEAIWLEKLGFGNYVSQLETGEGTEDSDEKFLKESGLSRQHTYVIKRRMTALRTTMKVRRGKWSREGRVNRGENSDSIGNVEVKSYSRRGVSPAPSPQSSPQNSRKASDSQQNSSPTHKAKRVHYSRGPSDHNVDSGVYSANSSRDSTPTPSKGAHSQYAHHQEQIPSPLGQDSSERVSGSASGTNNSDIPVTRSRSKVIDNSSPRRHGAPRGDTRSQHHAKLDQEGLVTYTEEPTRHRMRRAELSRSNLTPASLSLAAKPIDVAEDGQAEDADDILKRRSFEVDHMMRRSSSPPRYHRRASATPAFSSKTEPHTAVLKKQASSFTRSMSPTSPKKGAIESLRSLSPTSSTSSSSGRESMNSSFISSPDDIKLDFRTTSCSNISNGHDKNGLKDLPTFMISPDPLGITRIQDLSSQDMVKVRSVALLELTVTFDEHDIPLRPRRPARVKSYPENSLNGVPLTVLLQSDQKRDSSAEIPLIIHEILSYLETHCLDTEGLLRVPGSSSRVNSLLQELEASFHLGQFSFSDIKPSNICSLLKQFIRNLPVPILTREYLQSFVSIADISDLKEQVRTLNLLILLLPDVHQRVLKRLLEFLEQVVLHSSNNKMDLNNVAMVIAPNLFISLPAKNTLDDVTMAAKTSHVVRLLIKYHTLLWTIPGQMLKQIRYLYDNEVRKLNQRNVQKAIKQMNNQMMDSTNKSASEPTHHIIRVKAPLFTRVCMAVDVCAGVTAGDIISKLQKKSRLNKDVILQRFSSPENANYCRLDSSTEYSSDHHLKDPEELIDAGEQFLFETGGNIGERCLPNNTDMFVLCSENPNAQWIIKPRNCPDLN